VRRIDLSTEDGAIGRVSKYVTDSNNDLHRDANPQDLSALELSPRSVTTFVMDISGLSSITAPVSLNPAADQAVYDLFGRRLTSPKHGIYIRDGKKYVVR